MRSSSLFSTQERRYRPIVDQHVGIEEKGHTEQGATFNVISKRSAIIFKRHIIQNGMKLMKVHEKEAYFSVGLVIKPFTLVVVILLFISCFLTITFPVTSFDSERNLLTTAQQSWDSSSKRANKQIVKMWENIQETEAKIKMIITKKGKVDSIRSKLLYWEEMVSMLESLTNYVGNEPLKLGLLNYDNEINHELEDEVWGSLTSIDIVPQIVALAQANQSMTWGDLYPVWIDEEEVYETPRCPSFPMPEVEPNTTFDVVFAYVPCDPLADWRRDVLRLHLQLSIANVAVKSKSSYVLLHSRCPPFLNLFTCNDLALHKGNLWLYKVDIPKLQRRFTLPVGSCELAPPMKGTTKGVLQERKEKRREAYATILHSADMYVCGAIALGHSIRRTGSNRDMIILVDNNIQQHHRQGLQEAGWIVLEIERIRNPRADPETYNEYNYSKLRLWQLTAYKKIIFLDADVLVLRNIDVLFESEEISASGNSRTMFNSGLMVLEPSNCTFNVLMQNINHIVSYNGGDQGFLNEIFVWWHRLPRKMNFLKHFYSNSQEEFEEKTKLFGMFPPQLYVLHFLGYKPWLCFRDYDCSWLFPELRNFASDVAHATWWKLHDTMPHHLQQFCLLSLNQTYILTDDMDAASQLSSNPDPLFHWQRNITDPRFLHPTQE